MFIFFLWSLKQLDWKKFKPEIFKKKIVLKILCSQNLFGVLFSDGTVFIDGKSHYPNSNHSYHWSGGGSFFFHPFLFSFFRRVVFFLKGSFFYSFGFFFFSLLFSYFCRFFGLLSHPFFICLFLPLGYQHCFIGARDDDSKLNTQNIKNVIDFGLGEDHAIFVTKENLKKIDSRIKY